MKGLETKKEGAHIGRPSLNSCINGEINTKQIYKNYVPLDFFRADIIGVDVNSILNNDLLNFGLRVNIRTGEVILNENKNGQPRKPCEMAEYKGLSFRYFKESNKLLLSGSFHVFFNDGRHNHNRFDLSAFKDVLNDLYDLFGIMPENLYLYQLEWGVNLQDYFGTNILIDHLMFNRWHPFVSRYDSIEGRFVESGAKSSYYLKIYNKGLHKKLGRDILRIERKQCNWNLYCQQNKIGRTLEDLIQSEFKGLRKELLRTWENTVLFDPMIKDNNQRQMRYRDINFWKDLCRKIKENKKSRTTRCNHLNKLKEYNKKNGGDIQAKVYQLIEKEIDAVNNIRFTNFKFSYTSKTYTPKRIINTHYGLVS